MKNYIYLEGIISLPKGKRAINGEFDMKPEDITNNNTRKEMNSMAEEMGIEGPEGYKNKIELAEAMVPLMDDDFEEEAEEKMKEVKDLLKKVRKTSLKIDSYKDKFKELRSKKEQELYEDSIDIADELIAEGNKIIDSNEKVKDIRELLKETPDGDVKNGFKDNLKSIIKGFDSGSYSSLLNELEDIEDNIVAYNDRQDELEDKLKEAKKKLSDIRETKIEIDMLKELVHDAVSANKEKDFEKGLGHVEDFLDKSERIMEVYEKIGEAKEKVQELKGEDLEFKPYLDILKNCKNKADDGDYKYSLQLLNDAITDMEKDLKEKEEGEGGEVKEETEEERSEENNVSIDEKEIDKQELKNIHRKIEAIEKALKYIKRDLEKMMD